MSDIVQKLWGFCHTLRHDGVDYGDYDSQSANRWRFEHASPDDADWSYWQLHHWLLAALSGRNQHDPLVSRYLDTAACRPFQSTRPAWGATARTVDFVSQFWFQSTRPAWGATVSGG